MKPIITYWPSLRTSTGTAHEVSWDDLFSRFERPQPFRQDLHPGWSPVQFAGNQRSRSDVQRVYAMVLDVDGGWNLDAAAECLSTAYGFIHTSKSHGDVHRFRIILPVARSISAFEHDAIWRRIAARYPGRFDPQCKDPSRFWFTPCEPLNAAYESRRLRGQPIDPDALLAEPEPVTEEPVRHQGTEIEERARLYIATMPPAISGAGGHTATWRVACVLARGFALPEERVFRLLRSEYNPRCQPAWSDRELRHKAKQACQRSQLPFGYLLTEDAQEPSPVDYGPPPVMPTDDSEEELTIVEPAWKRYGVRTVAESLQLVYDLCCRGKQSERVSTGCSFLDDVIGGYRPEMVTVLGATTNWGKTSFSLLGFDLANRNGDKVLYVSGEDSERLIAKRLMAMRTGIDGTVLRDEVLGEADMAKMVHAVAEANHAPWFLNGVGKRAEWLAQAIADLCREERYKLVIVDYLQAFAADNPQDRRNEVRKVAALFGAAVKNGGAAGLFLSQLRRPEEAGQDWRPSKFHLKEAGDIENQAEHVVLGYTKGGKRMVYVDKNKDAGAWPEGIELGFNDKTGCFNRC